MCVSLVTHSAYIVIFSVASLRHLWLTLFKRYFCLVCVCVCDLSQVLFKLPRGSGPAVGSRWAVSCTVQLAGLHSRGISSVKLPGGSTSTEPKTSGSSAQLRQEMGPPLPLNWLLCFYSLSLSLSLKVLHPLFFFCLSLCIVLSLLLLHFVPHFSIRIFLSLSSYPSLFQRPSFPSTSLLFICTFSLLVFSCFSSSTSLSCSPPLSLSLALLLSSPACCHGAGLRCQTMPFSPLHSSK